MRKSILVIAAFLALCFIPGARAQVTQSAQLTTNVLNSTAYIVTLDTAAVALSELGNPTGPSAPVTIHNLAGGSAGHGICWKTDTTLGYCSSALDASGNCTCN